MAVIAMEHVYKKFRKGERFNSLRDAVPHFVKRLMGHDKSDGLDKQEFWALEDVSFAVEKGEVVGLIGPNGAGKSTILKLLSGIMKPTKGEMHIQGRLSALIEVTAGFHPELTGRENIYLNGTILGMSKKELDEKFDRIVAFSGLEEFIDTPVKRYSSGMFSRLGFSVAAHVDPDILLVDEVLAVGDIAFQAKCAQKMRELLSSGCTIVIVSHNLALVRSLCPRVILLHRGRILKEGEPNEVIPYYENIIFSQKENEFKKSLVRAGEATRVRVQDESPLMFDQIRFYDDDGRPIGSLVPFGTLVVEMSFKGRQAVENPIVSFELVRSDGVNCVSFHSKDCGLEIPRLAQGDKVRLRLPHLPLMPGLYQVRMALWDRDLVHPYDFNSNEVLKIIITETCGSRDTVFLPQAEWSFSPLTVSSSQEPFS